MKERDAPLSADDEGHDYTIFIIAQWFTRDFQIPARSRAQRPHMIQPEEGASSWREFQAIPQERGGGDRFTRLI